MESAESVVSIPDNDRLITQHYDKTTESVGRRSGPSGPRSDRCSQCHAPYRRRETPTPSRAGRDWTPQPVCGDCTRHRARVQSILKTKARALVGLTYAGYVREYGQGRAGFIRAGLTDRDFADAEAQAEADARAAA